MALSRSTVKASELVERRFSRLQSHADCIRAFTSELREIFDQIDLSQISAPPSATGQLKKLIEPLLTDNGWKQKIPLINDVPLSIPSGGYVVDYQKIAEFDGCGSRHQLSMELCFDNRQAILGNLAKADLATLPFESRAESNVGITYVVAPLNVEVKRKTGWDDSIATFEEYEYALDSGYREFIKSPVQLLGIR